MMMLIVKRFLKDKTGATAIEYGLIAALVSTALITGVGSFSNQLVVIFDKITSAISAVLTP